jgi:hypothetical protein
MGKACAIEKHGAQEKNYIKKCRKVILVIAFGFILEA